MLTYQNRGIGEAIANTLAIQFQGPFVLYATSRKGVDMAFKTSPETKVRYPKLDIADSSSIQGLAKLIKEDHGDVDVLINNAGVNLDDEYSAENVKKTLDTNVRGTLEVSRRVLVEGLNLIDAIYLDFNRSPTSKSSPLILVLLLLYLNIRSFNSMYPPVDPCYHDMVLSLTCYGIPALSSMSLTILATCVSDNFFQMCHTFIPILDKTGRIVNVSSTGSSLKQYSKEIQQRFRSSKMTLPDLESMMQEYQVRKYQ